MALGDCISPPCGSPLDLESILINLFGKESVNGCIGLKVILAPVGQVSADANICTTNLSFNELLLRSIADDGAGGHALRLFYVVGDMNCYPCAVSVDTDTLLKSLFIQSGDCFGIKVAVGNMGCEGVEPYSTCSTTITAEQLLRNVVAINQTYGVFLLINQLSSDCTNKLPCDLQLNLNQLWNGLINLVTGQCYGALNLNGVGSARTPAELKRCGDFMTFEQVFKSAITVVDCGYALNVFLIGMPA